MKHPLSRVLVVAAAVVGLPGMSLGETEAGKVPLSVSPKVDRPAEAALVLDGPIQRQVRGVIDNWLLIAPEKNPAILEMFADRDKTPYRNLLPWSGEFAGKYLTACVEMIRLTGDQGLRAKVQGFVDRLVVLQDEDGYLGPYPKAHRLTGKAPNSEATWDAWGHYHIMLGLMMWHDLAADAKALRCAEKIGDLLCARFLGGGKHVADMGSPDQNQAVIHGLCRLYRKTGTARYLELAEQIVKEFEIKGAGDYLRTALAGQEFYATPKPRWESLHAVLGLAELHRITGKEDYRRAFEHIWWSIVKLDRHNNGGFSSGEQAVGNPYHGAAIETCCTIAWLATSFEMLRTTGNSIVADEMELSTLNSVVGFHSADGAWCTYNTPMDGRRIPSTTDIAFQIRPGSEQLNCCSVNAARGFGMISDWALMTEKANGPTPAALVLNWYGPSSLSAQVGGAKVILKQETDYPRSGRVALQVSPERPSKFALKLRIPHWSAQTKVLVNDVETAAQPGSYCTINREWKAGDRVTLDLDFRLRAWVGERECSDKVSFYRGPILLVLDRPKSAVRQRPGSWQHFGQLHASREKGSAFEYDFEGEGIRWFGMLFDDAGKARVLIDGKEVAMVDQYGPVREKPFSWEHRGLAPGKHTIRIEVSGEKVAESRNTWSNVVGFGKPDALKPESPTDISPIDLARFKGEQVGNEDVHALGGYRVGDDQQSLLLRDFGTAGRNDSIYTSWIPVKNAQPVPFSTTNPLRTRLVRP
jgi:DUF1680 family protein